MNEIICSLGANIPVSDVLQLIVDNKIDCFVKRQADFRVYAEGTVYETIHVIKRRMEGRVNEIENPIELDNVRYLKISRDEVKELFSKQWIELSRFYEVLIGNSLERKTRLFNYSNCYFVAPDGRKIPKYGLYVFFDYLKVQSSDLHVLAIDFEKLKNVYFSKFETSQLIVENPYVTILNLCAYEYYKDGLGKKYVKDEIVSLIQSKSVSGVSFKKNDANQFATVLNRSEQYQSKRARESYRKINKEDLPSDVLIGDRHQCFTTKLIVINYLSNKFSNRLCSEDYLKEELNKYGFKPILAERVAKCLAPSFAKKDGDV
ncbi:hypothetical protein [Aquitalea pelogenes]|uniref:hypothetical protein n=1 Tax=Aquitalea pelogenes TaxID=1293573 RepID=UPI0035B0CB5E